MELVVIGFMVFVFFLSVCSTSSKQSSLQRNNQDDLDLQLQQMMQEQQRVNDEQNQHFMEESLKSVTPFEMGGYDMTQGNSWNNNDFNTFNDMNSFNDFNNFGMF